MKSNKTLAVLFICAATFAASNPGYAAASAVSIRNVAPFRGLSTNDPGPDFQKAATKAVPAVVHIKILLKGKEVSENSAEQDNPFKDFFGGGDEQMQGAPQQRASGSGVLISPDGYIVTNNHVVDQAAEIVVTLNNKTDYKAKVIGTDPSTDLAVVKIEGNNFPYLSFANSDNVHLGQWVLAIGYPLNLETTVTSGIVSAKSRSIGINSHNSNSPVESFIQTDAAVNPGNSGGALVNADGDIIGINSAIASPTGSFAGYSYAIPSNLVKKVADDILRYGSNHRAYLGIMYGSDQMSEEDRQKNNIKEGDGVFVMDVTQGGAADVAGIQKGDFITKINGAVINTGTELVEKVASLHPGDKIEITFQHNGAEENASATLKGAADTHAAVSQGQTNSQLGATFEGLDNDRAARLQIDGGVVVKSLGQGLLSDQTKIREGFIIMQVNDTKIASVEEFKEALKNAGNSAVISGIYPNNPQMEYQYAINDLNGREK